MECTQRLECTQELYATATARICPEQIGFLGICGAIHPILRGPNKIGRDPGTCSIVLNLNSVSRQHAVINILNSKNYMLMDLGSANKTMLLNNALQPYIPYPIKNGDTVQFGDIFGIFRLLEDDDELPMTQAIDIPETPVPSKHMSKLKAPTTLIPESPDVSTDKDDSFLTPTQQKNDRSKQSIGQYIKPFGQSLLIHAISTKKDTSPNSHKKSVNNLNNSLINESKGNDNSVTNIHEQSTCPVANASANVSTDSIYMADTQIPPGHGPLPTIYTMDTQMPAEHLPQVHKITDQEDMHFNIYAANKENELSIFNADTQAFVCHNDEEIDNENKAATKKLETNLKPKQSVNKLDEVIMFDELEDEYMEDFNSQPLLPQESPKNDNKFSTNSSKEKDTFKSNKPIDCDDFDIMSTQKIEELSAQNNLKEIVKNVKSTTLQSGNSVDSEDIEFMPTQIISKRPSKDNVAKKKSHEKKAAQRVIRIQSDSSTDCEDIDMIPTQKIPELKKDDDLTDCEDDFIELNTNVAKEAVKNVDLEDEVDFEDMPTQIIAIDPDKFDKTAIQSINNNGSTSTSDVSFEDQPTQIIEEINLNNSEVSKIPQTVSSFKVPLVSPIRIKGKEITNVESKNKKNTNISVDLENYYNATQDILNDLCTQRDGSPVMIVKDVVPCSVENYVIKGKFPNIDKDLSQTTINGDQKLKQYISGLSLQDVRDVIGVTDDNLKKNPTDTSSDNESTPKKLRTRMFIDSDLPNSQEIETSRAVALHMKVNKNDILSESEPEENNEEQYSPLLNRKKKIKVVAKLDLTKKIDVESLPERIITRVRKPTAKLQDNSQNCNKTISNILNPKFLTAQEDDINEEIINENVKRLKTYERAKTTKENKIIKNEKEKMRKIENSKIESKEDVKAEKPVQIKTDQSKSEKIKVKIVKPKKSEKDTKSISKENALMLKTKEESILKTNEKSFGTQSKEVPQKENGNDKNKLKENAIYSTPSVLQISTNNKNKLKETNSHSKSNGMSNNGKNKLKDANSHSKSDGQISTRSRRSRKKEKDNNTDGNKSESENNKKPLPDSKRKRSGKKKEHLIELASSDTEIRRSKRQANVKEKKSDSQTMQPPKSMQNKNDHEQSTVYNISSSGGESPKNLKRPLGDDTDVPSPKRTRAFMNNENNISNASLRATPARTMKTQYVLFTAFPSEEVKQKLEKLGAQVVTDVMKCSVVLTMQIKRTFKLLCAVGLGRPIVGPSWVQACVDTRMIVDPWLYLVKDEQAEKRFQFTLDKTLNGKREFLKGYNISSTPSVQPNGSEMKLIVECSGGIWREGGSNWVCVSCTKDQALWPALRKRGATIVSTEFILGGVLKQKLDINSNKFA